MYGHDFFLSQKMAETVYKYPLLLDAMASEMQRKGDSMMSKWAEIMTCMQVRGTCCALCCTRCLLCRTACQVSMCCPASVSALAIHPVVNLRFVPKVKVRC